jgi:hypothetical protein
MGQADRNDSCGWLDDLDEQRMYGYRWAKPRQLSLFPHEKPPDVDRYVRARMRAAIDHAADVRKKIEQDKRKR